MLAALLHSLHVKLFSCKTAAACSTFLFICIKRGCCPQAGRATTEVMGEGLVLSGRSQVQCKKGAEVHKFKIYVAVFSLIELCAFY